MKETKYTPKRLLSLLLALIMLLGMLPTAVFAADDTSTTLTTKQHHDTKNVVFDALDWTNNAQIGCAYSTNASGSGEERINEVTLSFDGFAPRTNYAVGETLDMNL